MYALCDSFFLPAVFHTLVCGDLNASDLTHILFQTAQIESNYDEITDNFDNMNLKGELLRGM